MSLRSSWSDASSFSCQFVNCHCKRDRNIIGPIMISPRYFATKTRRSFSSNHSEDAPNSLVEKEKERKIARRSKTKNQQRGISLFSEYTYHRVIRLFPDSSFDPAPNPASLSNRSSSLASPVSSVSLGMCAQNGSAGVCVILGSAGDPPLIIESRFDGAARAKYFLQHNERGTEKYDAQNIELMQKFVPFWLLRGVVSQIRVVTNFKHTEEKVQIWALSTTFLSLYLKTFIMGRCTCYQANEMSISILVKAMSLKWLDF